MTLNVAGHVDQTFATGSITITTQAGGYVDGFWADGAAPDPEPAGTTHLATKQDVTGKALQSLNSGTERYTDVARFYINDGSTHEIGSVITDQHGATYRVIQADNRPERAYCKLVGARLND